LIPYAQVAVVEEGLTANHSSPDARQPGLQPRHSSPDAAAPAPGSPDAAAPTPGSSPDARQPGQQPRRSSPEPQELSPLERFDMGREVWLKVVHAGLRDITNRQVYFPEVHL
jgi:hypothetical protein